jgi:hypothetical protein
MRRRQTFGNRCNDARGHKGEGSEQAYVPFTLTFTLSDLCYDRAVDCFGPQASAELIYLVGLYCMISITVNGFDVPVPD